MDNLTILKENQHKYQDKFMKYPNVVGVGVGKKIRSFKQTDEDCYVVLVTKKKPLSVLTKNSIIPKTIDGFVTDVVEVGEIVIHNTNVGRIRPPRPGYSIGHYKITAGTFGGVVYDINTGEQYILSNNHVLANSNYALVGDSILQPGPYDGGDVSNDVVAFLDRFVTINFSDKTQPPSPAPGPPEGDCVIAKSFVAFGNFIARVLRSSHRVYTKKIYDSFDVSSPTQIDQDINTVDAALAKPSVEVSEDIVDIGRIGGINLNPFIGMEVQKSGRTSGYTRSTITALNVLIKVGYGDNKTATFVHQILTGPLSQPGDSGSLVLDVDKRVIGMLFAGSNQSTVINPVEEIINKLNVSFK